MPLSLPHVWLLNHYFFLLSLFPWNTICMWRYRNAHACAKDTYPCAYRYALSLSHTLTHIHTYIYIYIYMYICVCVCVCVSIFNNKLIDGDRSLKSIHREWVREREADRQSQKEREREREKGDKERGKERENEDDWRKREIYREGENVYIYGNTYAGASTCPVTMATAGWFKFQPDVSTYRKVYTHTHTHRVTNVLSLTQTHTYKYTYTSAHTHIHTHICIQSQRATHTKSIWKVSSFLILLEIAYRGQWHFISIQSTSPWVFTFISPCPFHF